MENKDTLQVLSEEIEDLSTFLKDNEHNKLGSGTARKMMKLLKSVKTLYKIVYDQQELLQSHQNILEAFGKNLRANNAFNENTSKVREEFQRNLEAQKNETGRINGILGSIGDNLTTNNAVIERLVKETEQIKNEESKLKARVNNQQHLLSSTKENVEKQKQKDSVDSSYDCVDYFDFEDYFRGSQEHIRKSQEQYIPYFKGKRRVADLGCGRGEFLELLKENEIDSFGVEMYGEFVEYGLEKGLNVIRGDAIKFLEECESLGGIFLGQVVEHLELQQIVRLCNLSYEKLEQGASIIMETPNPTALSIYTHAFYIDPSHQKPVHPLMLRYFLQRAGFVNIEILYTDMSKLDNSVVPLQGVKADNLEAFNEGIKEMSELLFGSQDYAIIATK